MRHESTVDLPTAHSLHSVLQNALANLDVELETELKRYRRLRSHPGSIATPARRKSAPKLDLITVSAKVAGESHTATPPVPPPVTEIPIDATPHAVATPASPSPNQPASATLAIASPPEMQELSTEATPFASDAHLAATAPTADLVGSEPEIEDYLESSEELLRSLAAEEAQVQAERGFMRSLLTPLGLGSMLLLLLSSAMFGYVVMNPSSLTRLLPKWNTATTPESVPTDPSPDSPAHSDRTVPQPNLAAREFKDLDLSTLGTLKANSGKATPKASPKPKASPMPASGAAAIAPDRAATPLDRSPIAPSRPAAPVEPSTPAPPIEPAPLHNEAPIAPEPPRSPASADPAPQPQPEAIDPEPAPPTQAAKPTQTFPYKLVTPYEGDPSFDQAQKAAPDAFLTEGGSKIQVGAFEDAAAAAARASELRQQGITVEVQKR